MPSHYFAGFVMCHRLFVAISCLSFLFFHDNYYKDESSVLRSVLLFLQNTDNRLHRREISNIHAMTAAGIGDDFFLRTDGNFLVGGEKKS